MAEHTNIRKRANTYFLVKVAFNALLIVLGAETAIMRNQASHILLRHAQRFYMGRGFAS